MPDPVDRLRRLAWRALSAAPPPLRALADLSVRRRADARLRGLTPMPPAERRLYVGPRNTAGQGYAWAAAAQRHLPGVAAQNLWAQRSATQSHFHYPATHQLSGLAQRGRVRRLHGERVLDQVTHVLFESGRPVLGNFHAGSMLDDVPALDAAGIRHGVLYHGSEIRDLHQHAQRDPHSPFGGPERDWDDYLRTLQSIVERTRDDLHRYLEAGHPALVSTPDLLDVIPEAAWLPLVVDVERFATDRPVLQRDRPVVLHAPSNARLKGTRAVEEVLARLEAQGLVTYRRLTGVPHDRMPDVVGDADVVIDQVVLGNPGVLLAETAAAGRLSVAHLTPEVRERMARADRERGGSGVLPVLEAAPDTLEEVLRDVLARPAIAVELAAAGPGWARRNHDGRAAAAVLDQALLDG